MCIPTANSALGDPPPPKTSRSSETAQESWSCSRRMSRVFGIASCSWGIDIQTPGIHCRGLGTFSTNNAVGHQLKPCANSTDKRSLTRGFWSFSFHQNPFGIKKVEALSSWCLPTVINSSYNCFVRLCPIAYRNSSLCLVEWVPCKLPTINNSSYNCLVSL